MASWHKTSLQSYLATGLIISLHSHVFTLHSCLSLTMVNVFVSHEHQTSKRQTICTALFQTSKKWPFPLWIWIPSKLVGPTRVCPKSASWSVQPFLHSLPVFPTQRPGYTAKNIRISTDILWRAVWAHTLYHFVDLWIQTYTEPVPLKYGKLATKYPWIYGCFFTAYMRRVY